jgi:uncharacterized protein YjiS (DUF1127 family)
MRSRTWSETRLQPAPRKAADGALHAFLRIVAESLRRSRQRHDLALLSEHSLRDIGLSRADVEFELRKPFWRP